jgi:hypothetical protein
MLAVKDDRFSALDFRENWGLHMEPAFYLIARGGGIIRDEHGGVSEVARQISFDSRCPKCNLLAHQQADADTLKTDLESDDFRLYFIRCDHYSKPSPTRMLNILKSLP